jgi:hypothetical protein
MKVFSDGYDGPYDRAVFIVGKNELLIQRKAKETFGAVRHIFLSYLTVSQRANILRDRLGDAGNKMRALKLLEMAEQEAEFILSISSDVFLDQKLQDLILAELVELGKQFQNQN